MDEGSAGNVQEDGGFDFDCLISYNYNQQKIKCQNIAAHLKSIVQFKNNFRLMLLLYLFSLISSFVHNHFLQASKLILCQGRDELFQKFKSR